MIPCGQLQENCRLGCNVREMLGSVWLWSQLFPSQTIKSTSFPFGRQCQMYLQNEGLNSTSFEVWRKSQWVASAQGHAWFPQEPLAQFPVAQCPTMRLPGAVLTLWKWRFQTWQGCHRSVCHWLSPASFSTAPDAAGWKLGVQSYLLYSAFRD